MATTAADAEQSSLSQRSACARASPDCESEKFNDGQSSGEEKIEEVWRPEDA